MPQEIRVLCCYQCDMYQVDIVKKSNKWQCKVCGAKQSVKQVFHRGTGADCRLRAQKLNEQKISIERSNNEIIADYDWSNEEEFDEIKPGSETDNVVETNRLPNVSKWEKYCEEAEPKERRESDVTSYMSQSDQTCVGGFNLFKSCTNLNEGDDLSESKRVLDEYSRASTFQENKRKLEEPKSEGKLNSSKQSKWEQFV